ncbi:MAG: DUF1801 domain-containing protein [Rhodospirillaceae bacterium]|nr:DUF1801 domain-containing protein [Rhodospirillaceae bacterium]
MTKSDLVTEYIAGFPPKVQALLKKVRAAVRKAAPKADEGLSYRIPSYKQGGIVAYFAGFKNHIGFFPPTRDPRLKKLAAKYAGPKGNLQFPYDAKIPFGLIAKLVKANVRLNQSKLKQDKPRKTSKT